MFCTSRRSRFLILGTILTVASLLFALSYHSSEAWEIAPLASGFWNHTTDGQVTNSSSLQTPVPTNPWCEGDECWKGAWTVKRRYASLEELKPWPRCSAKGSGKKLLDVMNWVWTPTKGALREWDPESFVIRLLKSPGGLIIVGDSMSKQYFDTLTISLKQANISFETSIRSDFQHVHQLTLKHDDLVIRHLFERSCVLSSRLARPIVTLIEDDILISSADLRTITERVGTKKDFEWKSPFIQVDGWPNLVKQLAKPVSGEGVTVKEDTILVMNSGIHWSRQEFTMLKPRNNPTDEQRYLTEVYRQMVRVLSARFKSMNRLSIYYRATSPGHPNCAARNFPYRSIEAAHAAEGDVAVRLAHISTTEAEEQAKRRWDWDLFNVHNSVWRRLTVRLERERLIALVNNPMRRMGAKWYYLNVWDQALQRPDAHAQDCLNWCPPAIFNQWTQHLYHALLSETDKGQWTESV